MDFSHSTLFKIKIRTQPFRARVSPLQQARLCDNQTHLDPIGEAVLFICATPTGVNTIVSLRTETIMYFQHRTVDKVDKVNDFIWTSFVDVWVEHNP